MAFEGPVVTIAGLARIELPFATLRLCDSGMVKWGADTFRADDPDYGSIGAIEAFAEESGDEGPSASLTFLPATAAAASAICAAANQNSPMRFWVAEVDRATGAVVGTPELVADLLLDTVTRRAGKGTRRLEIAMVHAGERLMLVNEGNALTPTFHKSVWPGETGLDNATGKPVTRAWGVAAPPRGTTPARPGGTVAGLGAGLGLVPRNVA